jgi:amino-acid N-acetyltransferase
MKVVVRPAEPKDVNEIAALVGAHADRGEVLPRSDTAIKAAIGEWIVASENGTVIGCGSSLPYSATLSEVRSLVVADPEKGKGIGATLLNALIAKAKREDVHTLFALTRAVPFFERVGFSSLESPVFPEKVWRDCHLCPIQDKCDEHAVVLHLKHDTETVSVLTPTSKERAISDNCEG